jgi:hypothetical protein
MSSKVIDKMDSNLAELMSWVPDELHQALKQAYVLGAREVYKSTMNIQTLYEEYDNMVKGKYLWDKNGHTEDSMG